MSARRWSRAVVLLVGAACAAVYAGNDIARALESDTPSVSAGTVSRGSLRHGKRLPTSGPNFRAYSRLGAALGRTAVHHAVHATVLDAYGELARTRPEVTFVYGETGWPSGGRLRPHRTHQNGLSVDLFVPVRRLRDGSPATLPTWPWLRFGYDVEFDTAGRWRDYRIDFEALASHLAALDSAARRHGLALERVILAPEFVPFLREVPGGAALVARLPWMAGRPWVRHDEHFHVDFRLIADDGARTRAMDD